MTVLEAVEISKQYLVELVPELASTEIQLQELDVPPHGSNWKVTFSAMPVLPDISSFGKILRATRVAKTVEIDRLSGELVSMKNVAA